MKKIDRKGNAVYVYDRGSSELMAEPVMGERWLRLAYKHPLRPVTRLTVFKYSILTRLLGVYADSRLSRARIPETIRSLRIDTSEFVRQPEDFMSFNDFFTRRLKPECRPYDTDPAILSSPADCRLSCCPEMRPGEVVQIKGIRFDVARLLGRRGSAWAERFVGGVAVICRLSPADCHRYFFPFACQIKEGWDISGRLDSVSPFALRLGLPVFDENRRRVTMLESDEAGATAFIEIGAFGVGKIIHTHSGDEAREMEEKGFFAFGGSTIVLLFEPGRVIMDEDLLNHSRQGYETRVPAGQSIGRLL